MKTRFLVTITLILFSTILIAQKISVQSKFIIDGQLRNYKGGQLMLVYNDKNGERVHDLADIDDAGNFRIEGSKVTEPISASLQGGGFVNIVIFIAPSYHLHITADCTNSTTIKQSKQISGNGATANQYLIRFDTVLLKNHYPENPFILSTNDLIAFVNRKKRAADSVEKLVFNKRVPPDTYYTFFKKKVQLNSFFERIDYLAYHVHTDTTLSYQESKKYIGNNINPEIFKNIYNKNYLSSERYKTFMLESYYVYLRALAAKRNPSLYNLKNFYPESVKIIASNYQGEIKDVVLYSVMHKAIQFCRSFEELNRYKISFPQYIAQLKKIKQREELSNLLVSMEGTLLKTQIGQPAPHFSAVDSTGKIYALEDFKSKILVIDLWGSWCSPCRELTPYFKKFEQKFKNDSRITFMSISVFDTETKWKAAMKADNPDGLQLLDNNGTVQNNYVANSVPKFIVIRDGKIVTFDAPISNSFDGLGLMLNAELSK